VLTPDLFVVLAAGVAVCGVAPGSPWLAALATAVGAFALYRAIARGASADTRRAILGGLAAGAVVASGDWGLAQVKFLFHLRREAAFAPISFGVVGCRAVLFGALAFLYVRMRMVGPPAVAIPVVCVAGVLVGLAYEHLGVRAGLWDWNAALMPDKQIGSAWAFVPAAWGMACLCMWYFLMGFSRRVPQAFHPIGVGIRFGAAYLGFTMISYALFLRVYGKVVMP
jgi:hypothetical protein